ncbi:PREDICTED: WAT1-related protein At5g40240-like [Ipomoea nil]|uniref:WAT1-related protein At5g40240-like n=1 Tax=Ipomoea nil TaxID=35883 RepID=UPI0009017068|nr:PREDICTED: WAT1-related protein At5g40240-like [Ipomoea nil]
MVAMGNQFLSGEVLPFAAMIAVECVEVAIGTLSKAAMNAGLSTLVYIVYYNFLGTLLLLPTFIIRRRRSDVPSLTFSVLCKCFILGLLGICLMQICLFEGLKYSSPTLEGGISNLIPGFTFLLAVIFRMEKLDVRKASSQAKSLGTIVAIIGASVMTLYEGPIILGYTSSSDANNAPDQTVEAQQSNWVLGGVLFTGASLMLSGWNVLQTATVKEFPEQITIVFFTCCFGTIQCAIFSLFMERNLEAWILVPGIGIIAVVLSAIFGAVFNRNVTTWCLEQKGPLYVATFKPLFVVIAAFTSYLFLGDALHLGSVIGAIIIIVGFYTVMWGKAKEKAMVELEEIVCEPESPNGRSPLLHK